MATPKHPGLTDPHLPGEEDIAHLYKAGPRDEPCSALDNRLLSTAQDAVHPPRPRGVFRIRWSIPLASATMILLCLGVVLWMLEPGLLDDMQHYPASVSKAVAEPAPARGLLKTLPAAPHAAAPPMADQMPAAAPATGREAMEKRHSRNEPALPVRRRPAGQHEVQAEPPKAAALESRVAASPSLTQEADAMSLHANLIAVHVSGPPGAYEFSVTVRSPDKGCQQYADWWEVVGEDGRLFYRRVLLHSHVQEQPFTRRGGPVPVTATTRVWVRAHMNNSGYGGLALNGSVQTGFVPLTPPAGFAADLATQAPLPTGCDF